MQNEIKANELRIGNWVQQTKRRQQSKKISNLLILSVGQQGVNIAWQPDGEKLEPYRQLSGIPLTPEILEKAGFEDKGRLGNSWSYLKLGKVNITSHPKKDGTNRYNFQYDTSLSQSVDLLYIHQLQNLYYALTQTELKIEL